MVILGDHDIKKKWVSKTSIFELPRVKKCTSRLCTNPMGDPPPPRTQHFLSVYFFGFQHFMDHASQVDARIVSNSLTTPTLRQPLPDNGGPLADSPKSIPRSIDRRWRMIPGDGRIVGKANAKADNRPHADLLPQKSSDKIPNFMLQFGYPFARDPKNPRSGNGDPEPNSAFKFGDQDVQRNAGDNIPNELEVQRNAGGNIPNELEVQRTAGGSIPNEQEVQRHAGGNIPNELEVQHNAGGNVPNELEVRRNAGGDILNELEVQHNARGNISNELATSPAPCRGGSHWCYATGENTDLFPPSAPSLDV